ncbi:response regulator [bacterium]|nr:response regulator [bacterium]MBL7052568.1 response regulator [Candidatus Neomarinimicrobiota bacterium]
MNEKQTILIIDDDIDLVEILRINLENAGFDVIDAQDGQTGIKLAQEKQPSAILLDVMMGVIDEGFQVAYQLKQQPKTKDVPILMLTAVGQQTGYKFDSEKDEDFLPVDEFIEKPVNPKRLVDLIRTHLTPTM